MPWQVIVALIIAVPIVFLPLAFVWYLNAGGVITAMRGVHTKRAKHSKTVEPENISTK